MALDLSAKEASVGGTPLHLTKSEYAICELLALHAGQTFSKEQIYEAVFGYDGTADDTAITQHIKTSAPSCARPGQGRCCKRYGEWATNGKTKTDIPAQCSAAVSPLCGGGCALILVLWWVIFMQLINIGFLLPAVASAQACANARETVASMTADTFDSLQISDLCRWAVVQNDTVLQTNMDDRHLKIALNAFHGGSGNLVLRSTSTMSKWRTEAFCLCSTTMLRPTPTRPCGTRCRISRPAILCCWRRLSSFGWAGRPTAPCAPLPQKLPG